MNKAEKLKKILYSNGYCQLGKSYFDKIKRIFTTDKVTTTEESTPDSETQKNLDAVNEKLK